MLSVTVSMRFIKYFNYIEAFANMPFVSLANLKFEWKLMFDVAQTNQITTILSRVAHIWEC